MAVGTVEPESNWLDSGLWSIKIEGCLFNGIGLLGSVLISKISRLDGWNTSSGEVCVESWIEGSSGLTSKVRLDELSTFMLGGGVLTSSTAGTLKLRGASLFISTGLPLENGDSSTTSSLESLAYSGDNSFDWGSVNNKSSLVVTIVSGVIVSEVSGASDLSK